MSNPDKKHIVKMTDRILVIASSIILRLGIFTDNLVSTSQVKDESYYKLLLSEEFKLDDEFSECLTLYCHASSKNGGISIVIVFPQKIPDDMDLKALKIANHINTQGHPCAISLKHDGRFVVSSSATFTKYFNDEVKGFEALQGQVDTVINLLTELLSVAKILSISIAKNFKDIPVSSLTTWESLIPEYSSGRCIVSPITNENDMESLHGINPDLDVRLKHEQGWRGFCRHERRVFSIQSKKYRSIVWISYLGHRGSLWHVIGHYSNDMNKVTKTHKIIAHDLAEKYQELWDAGINEK
ncbi:MAG: hypothetical protein ABL920_00070 [Methylotenera sp.]